MRSDDLRPTPVDPKWAQLAGMHAELLNRMTGLVDVLEADSRRKEALAGRADLAVLEEEYTAAGLVGVANVANPLQAKTANYFLVEQITWSIPNGATGSIQLGDRVIPITAQANSVGARMLLAPNDVRAITASANGAVFLHLAGKILSPQSWLH